jgi:DnaJ-domain-containing protein 1
MKKPKPMLIHRTTREMERSISNHKRAYRKLRSKPSPETIKEERAAFKQLMEHRPSDQIDYFSALEYIRFLRGVLIRRA